MTARRGITADAVFDAAVALVAADGADALTLSRVARDLGVKPPSLYSHVDGLNTLRLGTASRIQQMIGTRLGSVAMGRSGADALHAIANELRAFAKESPGLYDVAMNVPVPSVEFANASLKTMEPLLAVLRSYDLDDEQTIHAARAVRSALQGFVSIERAGGFGLDVDIDDSYRWLVDGLTGSLERG